MQGISGTFAIGGQQLNTPPTESMWLDKEKIGSSGDATSIYPRYRKYQLSWSLLSPTDVSQLNSIYQTVQSSGTVIADLPAYAASTYTFKSYTGCTLDEPKFGKYFNGYYTDVILVVNRIPA